MLYEVCKHALFFFSFVARAPAGQMVSVPGWLDRCRSSPSPSPTCCGGEGALSPSSFTSMLDMEIHRLAKLNESESHALWCRLLDTAAAVASFQEGLGSAISSTSQHRLACDALGESRLLAAAPPSHTRTHTRRHVALSLLQSNLATQSSCGTHHMFCGSCLSP